jgi:hypothetical protein
MLAYEKCIAFSRKWMNLREGKQSNWTTNEFENFKNLNEIKKGMDSWKWDNLTITNHDLLEGPT